MTGAMDLLRCALLTLLLAQGMLAKVPQFVPMDFSIVPEDTAVVPGKPAMLACSSTYNGGPPDVYSWERNSVVLSILRTDSNKLILLNGSLSFSSVQEGSPSPDPGTYRCIAEKIGRSKKVHRISSPEAHLRLAYKGDFNVQPADISVAVGDSPMLECRTRAYPAATYSWTKGGRALSATENTLIHGDGEVLELLSVTSAAAGRYQCHATNMAGVIHSRSASLTVTQAAGVEAAAPVFLVKPRDVSTKIGTSATLYCAVSGRGTNGDKPRITWLRQGSTITVTSGSRYELVGTGSLRISNVSKEDKGRYTCRGSNSVDVTDSEVSLTVLIAPYFETPPSNTYGRVDTDAELKCDIRGYPQPRIYWLKNSAYCTPSQYFKMVGGNIRVMGLMMSDAGYYQCIGENSVGKVYGTAQLIVLDQGVQIEPQLLSSVTSSNGTDLPPPPTGLKTVLVSHTYVSFTWDSALRSGIAVTGYTVSAVSLSDQSTNARVRSANTSSTDYTMQGLQPNTEYLFKVSAYNRHGKSRTANELRVRTSTEAAVPGPVRNLRTTAVFHQSIHLTWSTPAVTNGNILEYKVFYYTTDQSQESNITTTLTSAAIGDLDPYTEYHIRVVAFNSNGQGIPSAEQTIQTLSAKPSVAPRNVVAEVMGTNSITLRWTPPPSNTINGQITGYKIKYKATDSFARATSHTTDADARHYAIQELESGTRYQLRVGAVNINGTGEFSSWVEASTHAAELDESHAPGRPRKLQVQPFARELLVTWIPANESVLIRGYKLGYGKVTPDEAWLDVAPGRRLTSLTNLKPMQNYVLQLFAFNRVGQGPSIQQQTFTTMEVISVQPQTKLLRPVELRAMIISSRSAIVTWYDSTLGPRQENLDGRIYTVKYNALSGIAQRRTQYANTSNLIVTLENLKPFTEYEFSVMLSKEKKTSGYSLSIRNITNQDAPATAPGDLTIRISETKANFLSVSWQPPTQPNGRITTYTLYSNTDDTRPLEQWAQDGIAGHTLNHEFGPVTSNTVYHFIITARTHKGVSPISPVVTIKTPNGKGLGGYGFNGEGLPLNAGVQTTGKSDADVVSERAETASSILKKYPFLLWIIIACVAAVLIIAIAVFLAIICSRRKRSKATAKQHSPRGGVTKPAPPDLWADHGRHELNGMRHQSETDNETDEMTSMMQSNFDVSVSMAGDVPYHDDGRFSSMTRSGRPVIIASNHHREGMPRAAVPPMSSDPSRPLYPRTQFATGGQYDSTPRVHVGDTSQPSSEHYHQPHMQHHGYSGAGGTPHSPQHKPVPQSPSSSESSRGYPLKHFQRPSVPPSHLPKHVVKPQPVVFKMTNQMTSSGYQPTSPSHLADQPSYSGHCAGSPPSGRRGSQKRPARQTSQSPNLAMNNLSTSREDLKTSMMTHSTEQLSAEMAHLDCIMQDLNAIKTDFEMA